MNQQSYRWPLVVGVIIILAFVAYSALTLRDQRSPTDKLSDAIRVLPEGVDKSEQQLEDRTPGQRLGDAVKDEGDKLKNNTNP